MLGTKLLLTLLSLIVTVSAQQTTGWRLNRPFSRFPNRIIPRPAYSTPNPGQTVASVLPPAVSTPAPSAQVQVTTDAKSKEIIPSTRTPIVPSYIPSSQRSPLFWRPRPWSQPSTTFRPNRIFVYPSPNVVSTPKPQISVIYPANYKPDSVEPALVRESDIIPEPSSPSRPQVMPITQRESADFTVSTTAFTIIYPESITKKPNSIRPLSVQPQPASTQPSAQPGIAQETPNDVVQPSTQPLQSNQQTAMQPSNQRQPEIQEPATHPQAQPLQETPQSEAPPSSQPQQQASMQPPLENSQTDVQPSPQPQPEISQPVEQPSPPPQPEVSPPSLQPSPQPEITQPGVQPSAEPQPLQPPTLSRALPLNPGNPRFLGQNSWSKPIWSFVSKPWISTTIKPFLNKITAPFKPSPSLPPQPQSEVPQPAQPSPQPEIVLPSGQPSDSAQPEIAQTALQTSAQPEPLKENQGNSRFLGQNSWSKPIWSIVTKPATYIPWISTTAKPLINRITAALKPVPQPSPSPQPEVSQTALQPSAQPESQPQQNNLQPEISRPALQPSAQPESLTLNQGNTRFLGQNSWSKPIWSFVSKPLSNLPWKPSTIKPLIPRITDAPKPTSSPSIGPRMPAGPEQMSGLMDYQCAKPNGYFPVPRECDNFIECKNYVAIQVVCPDGLHFNPNTVWPEYPCDYPSIVRCGASQESQPPHPTASCPRQNGYFPSISGDCAKYTICQEGKATEMTCPSGLAFNYDQSICDWPANVPSCNPDVFKGFSCPAPDVDEYGKPSDAMIKYRFNKSCKNYIACQRGSPRLLSCDQGFSYDDLSQSCVDSDLVADCI